MEGSSSEWPAVRRAGQRRVAELSLVLQSLGMPHRMRAERGFTLLEVPAGLLEHANAELERYERENVGWPPPRTRFQALKVSLIGPVVYGLLLVLVHSLAHASELGPRLLATGRVEGEAVARGEVWRALTALTLHADVTHLAGNLFLGAALGHLCAQVIGSGVAWLGILAAGTLGNLVNVWMQGAEHRSIGASTAVFGAIGLLAALQWHEWGSRRGGWLLRISPLLVAGAMLGYLGTTGERTDVGAHITGMVAGITLGVLFRRGVAGAPGRTAQTVAGGIALALVAVAWILALGEP